MTIRRSWACRNNRCEHYLELRDGQGPCRGCQWITTLAQIVTKFKN